MFRRAGMIGYPSGNFIQLSSLLTGARRDEIGRLRWSEIVHDEVEGAAIALPEERASRAARREAIASTCRQRRSP